MTIGVPSLSAPKLVKFRFGGPKLTGFVDVPAMPNSAAMFGPLAKNGLVSFRLRLKLTLALLISASLRLCVQLRFVEIPEPLVASKKPNGWDVSPLRRW